MNWGGPIAQTETKPMSIIGQLVLLALSSKGSGTAAELSAFVGKPRGKVSAALAELEAAEQIVLDRADGRYYTQHSMALMLEAA